MKKHVLYSFGEDYAKVAAVSMLSLVNNNTDIEIHAFTINISSSTVELMKKWLASKNVCINFYDINDKVDIYRKIYGHRMNHVGTFGRLLATNILPDNISEILYLDCDTLVLSNLDEIFKIQFNDNLLAGVYDMALPAVNVKNSLGLDDDAFYINAGIVYINLNEWRRKSLHDEFYTFCKNHPNAIFFDQDALNYVCKGKILKLSPKYNFTFISSELPIKEAKKILDKATFKFYSEDIFVQSQKCPAIIHFASELFGKPWFDISNIKFCKEWRELYCQTPWKEQPLSKRIYSKNKYINIYKKYCEKIITYFYIKHQYDKVTILYNILYKTAHKFYR